MSLILCELCTEEREAARSGIKVTHKNWSTHITLCLQCWNNVCRLIGWPNVPKAKTARRKNK